MPLFLPPCTIVLFVNPIKCTHKLYLSTLRWGKKQESRILRNFFLKAPRLLCSLLLHHKWYSRYVIILHTPTISTILYRQPSLVDIKNIIDITRSLYRVQTVSLLALSSLLAQVSWSCQFVGYRDAPTSETKPVTSLHCEVTRLLRVCDLCVKSFLFRI